MKGTTPKKLAVTPAAAGHKRVFHFPGEPITIRDFQNQLSPKHRAYKCRCGFSSPGSERSLRAHFATSDQAAAHSSSSSMLSEELQQFVRDIIGKQLSRQASPSRQQLSSLRRDSSSYGSARLHSSKTSLSLFQSQSIVSQKRKIIAEEADIQHPEIGTTLHTDEDTANSLKAMEQRIDDLSLGFTHKFSDFNAKITDLSVKLLKMKPRILESVQDMLVQAQKANNKSQDGYQSLRKMFKQSLNQRVEQAHKSLSVRMDTLVANEEMRDLKIEEMGESVDSFKEKLKTMENRIGEIGSMEQNMRKIDRELRVQMTEKLEKQLVVQSEKWERGQLDFGEKLKQIEEDFGLKRFKMQNNIDALVERVQQLEEQTKVLGEIKLERAALEQMESRIEERQNSEKQEKLEIYQLLTEIRENLRREEPKAPDNNGLIEVGKIQKELEKGLEGLRLQVQSATEKSQKAEAEFQALRKELTQRDQGIKEAIVAASVELKESLIVREMAEEKIDLRVQKLEIREFGKVEPESRRELKSLEEAIKQINKLNDRLDIQEIEIAESRRLNRRVDELEDGYLKFNGAMRKLDYLDTLRKEVCSLKQGSGSSDRNLKQKLASLHQEMKNENLNHSLEQESLQKRLERLENNLELQAVFESKIECLKRDMLLDRQKMKRVGKDIVEESKLRAEVTRLQRKKTNDLEEFVTNALEHMNEQMDYNMKQIEAPIYDMDKRIARLEASSPNETARSPRKSIMELMMTETRGKRERETLMYDCIPEESCVSIDSKEADEEATARRPRLSECKTLKELPEARQPKYQLKLSKCRTKHYKRNTKGFKIFQARKKSGELTWSERMFRRSQEFDPERIFSDKPPKLRHHSAEMLCERRKKRPRSMSFQDEVITELNKDGSFLEVPRDSFEVAETPDFANSMRSTIKYDSLEVKSIIELEEAEKVSPGVRVSPPDTPTRQLIFETPAINDISEIKEEEDADEKTTSRGKRESLLSSDLKLFQYSSSEDPFSSPERLADSNQKVAQTFSQDT